MTKVAMLIVALVVTGCDLPIQVDAQEQPEELYQVRIDPEMLCADTEITDTAGHKIKGTRLCAKKPDTCVATGDVNCFLDDASLYRLRPEDLIPENIKKGVVIEGVHGTSVDRGVACSSDGQTGCVTNTAYRAATTSTIAAKVVAGEILAGQNGLAGKNLPDPSHVLANEPVGTTRGTLPACSRAGQSGCVLAKGHMALDPAAVLAGDIKQGVKVARTLGTFETPFPNCTADDAASCVARGGYRAVEKTRVTPSALRSGFKLLGISGNQPPRPADCASDGATGCVAADNFKALELSTVHEGSIRQGITIAGVAGQFPSATYPLAGADAATADLTAASFASQLAGAARFEFWDATGARHTKAGSSDLAAPNIAPTKTIFGIAGSLTPPPAPCAADDRTDCVATGAFPALDKSALSAADLRSGTVIAGVTGTYPSAANPLAGNTARAELNFPADISKAGEVEYWDAFGGHHVLAGDTDLQPGNIVTGVTLFGVVGTAAPRPADCALHDETGCVAVTAKPSYRHADLVPAVVKKSAVIGKVTGQFPSAAAPLAGTATQDLTAAGFHGALASASAFEFFDATGLRHQLSGSPALNSANILRPLTVFGVAGTLDAQPPPCSLTKTGCLTTASFPSYDKNVLTPAVIKSGVAIGLITGDYPSASFPLADNSSHPDLTATNFSSRLGSTATFEYWTAGGVRQEARGDSNLSAANIRSGRSILGVAGSAAAAPAACASENAVGCTVSTGFKTYDHTKLSGAIVKTGVTILGVTGSYPSAANPLAAATATKDLTATQINSYMSQNDPFEFFDAKGQRHTATGSIALVPANLRDDITLFDVTGTLGASKPECSGANQLGCQATASFPAVEKATVLPAHLKKGVSFVGVTGDFPSASHPLPDNTAMVDLTSSNFNSRVKDSGATEFFTAAGSRQQVTGDGDIQPGNIGKTVDLFGTIGAYSGYAGEGARWDYTNDTIINGLQGRIKINCRNMSHHVFYDEGPEIYRTIDDENLSDPTFFPNHNPWFKLGDVASNMVRCRADIYTDVSVDTSGTKAICVANPSNTCMFFDNLSRLTWHQVSGNATDWNTAKQRCDSLSVAGKTNWRLPSQKEALTAHVNTIHRLKQGLGATGTQKFKTAEYSWTSTVDSADTSKLYQVRFANGHLRTQAASASARVHCVTD